MAHRDRRHHRVQVVKLCVRPRALRVKEGVDGLLDNADGVVGAPVQVRSDFAEDVLGHVVERGRPSAPLQGVASKAVSSTLTCSLDSCKVDHVQTAATCTSSERCRVGHAPSRATVGCVSRLTAVQKRATAAPALACSAPLLRLHPQSFSCSESRRTGMGAAPQAACNAQELCCLA